MDGRRSLVTGAGRGIGAAVARRLSAAGHRVALTARSADELAALAAVLPGPSLVLPADVTDPDAVEHVYGEVERAWGPVEVLVLNAGAGTSAPLARTTDADWQRMLDLNLTAPFRMLRRAIPPMVDAGWGRVVAVASVAAKRGEPYIAAYTASKHGLLGLVRSAACELATSGVTVNAVCPGATDTPMWRQPGNEDWKAWKIDSLPIKRLGQPIEIAWAYVYLASDEASYCLGQSISPNGGDVMW